MSQQQRNRETLIKYWGYSSFREKQEDIINAVLEGRDTLALLPTGGGKSVCFQLPTIMQEGVCLVISPLIALMNDQVQQLQKKGIKAIAITSGMSKRQIDIGLDNVIYGDYKFLYVSPERLETEIFNERLKKMKICLVAIDEAHCISQWGYDFRPSYLKIANLKDKLKEIPFIALTATATQEVIDDIQEKLLFKEKNVLRTSFFRQNISYVVLNEDNKETRAIKIINRIKGSGVVYVNSRKKTKRIAELLIANKISADYYHAGLKIEERNRKQEAWQTDKTKVIVATNAFGMGIDKPNVRFVIHLDLPHTLEAYFQEAGRAGRDGKKSYAIVLWDNKKEIEKGKEEILAKYPAIEKVRKVYLALGNYLQVPVGGGFEQSFPFDLKGFASKYKFQLKEAHYCIKQLVQEGYIILSEEGYKSSTLHIKKSQKDLYSIQIQNKNYDLLIKSILRTYGGLFDGFVRINESDVSKHIKQSKNSVVEILKRLKELDIVDYQPQTELPQLGYLRPRENERQIVLSNFNYTNRKKIEIDKWKAISSYINSKRVCRSKQLLSYFGEKESKNCGICDICIEKNRKTLQKKEKNNTQEKIIRELRKKKLTSIQLAERMINKKEEEILKELSFLVDNRHINTDGTSFWID